MKNNIPDSKKTTCVKASFARKVDADWMIDKLVKTSKRARIPVRSYLCPKCHLWHITSQDRDDFKTFRETINMQIELITKMAAEITELKKQNHELEQNTNKKDRLALKGDAVLMQQQKEITELKKRFKKALLVQKENISYLISQNIRLKNEIEVLSKNVSVPAQENTAAPAQENVVQPTKET